MRTYTRKLVERKIAFHHFYRSPDVAGVSGECDYGRKRVTRIINGEMCFLLFLFEFYNIGDRAVIRIPIFICQLPSPLSLYAPLFISF